MSTLSTMTMVQQASIRPGPLPRTPAGLPRGVRALACLAALAAGLQSADAAEELRLIDRPPHDVVVLKDKEQTRLIVEPLALPNRRLPERPRSTDRLRLKLAERPVEEYEVRWSDVAEVKLHEQMVLDEAQRLAGEGRFDEAFDYFQYLQREYPEYPGVTKATNDYLMEDAKALARGGRQLEALAVLLEVRGRDRQHPGLAEALAATFGALIEEAVARDDYPAARRHWSQFAAIDPQSELVGRSQERLVQQAARRLDAARRAAESGDPLAAREAATDAVRIWPAAADARAFLAEQSTAHPLAVVAVRRLAGSGSSAGSWEQLRTARLVNRQLMERVAESPEGAVYASPLGRFTAGSLGLDFSLELRHDLAWSSGAGMLSGYDVARQLWQLCDAAPGDDRIWAGLLASVSVRDVYTVDFRLTRPHLRPEALLLVPALRWVEAQEPPIQRSTLGPYRPEAADGQQIVYRLIDGYFAKGPTQPMTLVERRIAAGEEALAALRNGRVAVVDRLNPWEVAHLASDPELVVEPYAAPSVHYLVPNPTRRLTAHRAFRRALLYGLPREGILDHKLLRGRAADGSQILSGPFPTGYAYGPKSEDVAYDPLLALALAAAARRELAQAAAGATQADEKPARDEPPASGADAAAPLRLCYPATDLARRACTEIRRQLAIVGIQLELCELPDDMSPEAVEDFDLLYVERVVVDPVVDARVLLGSGGLVRRASPHMDLALARLEAATDWQAAREALADVRRLAQTELGLIPLWQIVDYAAYHRSLAGVGSRPVSLYQNVENWQVSPWFPTDAE